ncbi:MAG: TrkH family potassium uptake protein [Christensenellaceae bacterium]|nr:TrkH family potassium uptake protein [Christensenellaceae bacterium]
MNKRLVLRLLGAILLIEALAMAPSLAISLLYGDGDALALLSSMALLAALGFPAWRFAHPREQNLRAREGFLVVALSWVLLSAFGALPFVISGLIPNYIDAFFEAVSGFTTTGATLMGNFEGLPRGVMFWRSFTHWIGGMGVLVLTLALLPQMTGRSSHLVRAESPGPSLSKIVPKMGDTAKILYLIYGALTMIELAALIIAGMSPYDAAIHAMGTAGTGGFSNYGSSVGAFDSAVIDAIITFFMVLFGINFALFYRVLVGGWRDALSSEELHWYLALFAGSTLFVSLMILPQYGTFLNALRYGSFQVATIMSTTGYATADFNLWPQAVKALIVVLMFIGSCAGSTAGGIKVVRVGILCKLGCREVRRTFQPRKVQVVRFEGKGVEENRLTQVSVFFFVYVLLVLVGMFLVSLEGLYDLETNFTAVLTCISNVGPGLGHVGPVENFSGYGPFAKVVLSLLMLAGRLELFPILVLFHPSAWRKG